MNYLSDLKLLVTISEETFCVSKGKYSSNLCTSMEHSPF